MSEREGSYSYLISQMVYIYVILDTSENLVESLESNLKK